MKFAIIISLMAMGPIGIYAQGGNYMISYPIAFPMGNLHDYISSTSFRGITLEFNKKVGPQKTVGLETGWNVFYQHVDSKTYNEGTASITGVQYRYTNSVPIIAGAKYYAPMKSKATRPYIGLGLGTLYTNRSTDFGLYRITSEAWQFCIRPELGIEARMGDMSSFFVGAKYYWAFNGGDLDAQPYLTVNIGFKIAPF
jgi:hypothetical protein